MLSRVPNKHVIIKLIFLLKYFIMRDYSVLNLHIKLYLVLKFLFLDPNNPQTVSALNKTGQRSYVCAKVISITNDNAESYAS